MASQTETRTGTVTALDQSWLRGVVAGLVGGAGMGVLLTLQMTPVIEGAIPSMYGLSGGAAGWVVHMAHSAVLGVGFAAVAARVPGANTGRRVALGLAYGVVLWAVLAALVMPVWLDLVGSAADPPLPNVGAQSLVGHAVYGLVLGGVYGALGQ
jgi:uncharacterized membrane protein YagU involved in acid resistance